MIAQFFLVYVIGYVASLWLMHQFKDELDINVYDPPHEDYYDDYENNATAYASISLMWPLFWAMALLMYCWKLLVKFSKLFEKKSNEEKEILKRIKFLEQEIADSPDKDLRDAFEIRHWEREITLLKHKLETIQKPEI